MLLGEFWYDPAPFGNNDDDDDDDNDDDDASVFSLLVVSSHSNVQFTIYRLPPRLFGFPSLLFHLSLRAVRRDQTRARRSHKSSPATPETPEIQSGGNVRIVRLLLSFHFDVRRVSMLWQPVWPLRKEDTQTSRRISN